MSERAQFDGWTAEINSSCPPTMAAFIRQIVAPLVPAGQPWAYRFEATS